MTKEEEGYYKILNYRYVNRYKAAAIDTYRWYVQDMTGHDKKDFFK